MSEETITGKADPDLLEGMTPRVVRAEVAMENEASVSRDLREALRHAREKLMLYRKAHSGEYIGGMEYSQLMRQIDAALAK